MQQLNLLFKIATAIAIVGWALISAALSGALTGKVVSNDVAGLLAVL